MTFLEKLQMIERLDQMIRMKATGSPDDLATKLHISKRCVYDYIDLLRTLSAPVQYDGTRKTYFYEYEVNLVIGFEKKMMDTKKVVGGKSPYQENIFKNIFHSASFLH